MFSESELIARRDAEMVRRTRELSIKGVIFCGLKRKEKRALKANCVAHSKEKVETGRYKSPYELFEQNKFVLIKLLTVLFKL